MTMPIKEPLKALKFLSFMPTDNGESEMFGTQLLGYRAMVKRHNQIKHNIILLLVLTQFSILFFPKHALQAKEIPRFYKSARALGMGNTGISNVDDEGAQFYNPANIATGKSRFKRFVGLSPFVETSEEFLNIYKDINAASGNIVEIIKSIRSRGYPPYHVYLQNYTGIVFKRTAFGIFTSLQADTRMKLTGYDLDVSASAKATVGSVLTVAHDFFKQRLLIGATGKWLYRGSVEESADLDYVLNKEYANFKPIDRLGKGSAFGADLGLTYRMTDNEGTPTFGLTIKDVGGTNFSKPVNPNAKLLDNIPMTVNLGLSIYPESRTTRVVLSLDYLDLTNGHESAPFKKLHVGGEISFKGIIGASAGLNQGYPSFGGFLSFKILRFEGGVYTEETGEKAGQLDGKDGDKRYFATISIGY